MNINDIYHGAGNLINSLIRKEHTAQGHYLTGELERSLDNKVVHKKNISILEGYAIYYAKILEEGMDPEKISWKMLPGLIKYFILRGVGPEEAKLAASRTIKKWMSEGMSTQASKRFSSTGARHHFIEASFLNPEIDAYMSSTFDFAVDEEYKKTKSETI